MTRNHIRVPEDISIVGYDDIDSSHQHRQVIFEPELVVRQSTQPAS